MSYGTNHPTLDLTQGRVVYSEIGYDYYYDDRGNKHKSGDIEQGLFINVGRELERKGFLNDFTFTKIRYIDNEAELELLRKERGDDGEGYDYLIAISDISDLFRFGDEYISEDVEIEYQEEPNDLIVIDGVGYENDEEEEDKVLREYNEVLDKLEEYNDSDYYDR